MVGKISTTSDSEIIGGFLEVAMRLIIMMQFSRMARDSEKLVLKEIELMRLLVEILDFLLGLPNSGEIITDPTDCWGSL